MRIFQSVIFAVLVASCAGATHVGEPPPSELGTQHVVKVRAIEPVDTRQKLGAASPAAQELLAAVQRFDSTPSRPTLAIAFHSLADAIAALVPDRESDVLQVRDAIDRTHRASPTAMSDAEVVRLGLDAASGMLGAAPTTSEPVDERLHAAVAELRAVTQLVDPTRGIAEQTPQLAAAMHAAVRAVYAAANAPEPVIAIETATR